MLSYWKQSGGGVVLYLRNYNYETIYARFILKWQKSTKTGVWYVMIKTMSGDILQYRIADIILIRKCNKEFTTLDVVKHGRRKMFTMRRMGRLWN